MQCRTPEEETAQLDAQAEIAPHIQDDFDIAEDTLQTLDVKDNPEFQVSNDDAVIYVSKVHFRCASGFICITGAILAIALHSGLCFCRRGSGSGLRMQRSKP